MRKRGEIGDVIAVVVDIVTGIVNTRVNLFHLKEKLYYCTFTDSRGRRRHIVASLDANDKIGTDSDTGRPVYLIWGTFVTPDIFVGFSRRATPSDKFLRLSGSKGIDLMLQSTGVPASEHLGELLGTLLEDVYKMRTTRPTVEVTPHIMFAYSGRPDDLVMTAIYDAVKTYEDADNSISQIIKTAGTLDKLKGLLHVPQKNYIAMGIMFMLILIGLAVVIAILMGGGGAPTTHHVATTVHHIAKATTSGGVHVVKTPLKTVAKPSNITHIKRITIPKK